MKFVVSNGGFQGVWWDAEAVKAIWWLWYYCLILRTSGRPCPGQPRASGETQYERPAIQEKGTGGRVLYFSLKAMWCWKTTLLYINVVEGDKVLSLSKVNPITQTPDTVKPR